MKGMKDMKKGGRRGRQGNKRRAEPLVSERPWRCGGKCGEACAAGVFSNWLWLGLPFSIYLTLTFGFSP